MTNFALISFIIATAAVAFFTYTIVQRMKRSDNATEEYFTGGRALSWPVVAGSLLLTNLSTEQLVGLKLFWVLRPLNMKKRLIQWMSGLTLE